MEDKEVLDQVGRVYMWASTMFVFTLGVIALLAIKVM